ncbi:calcium-binding protein [Methylopila sp. M107]|uniref:calcium-binding protein n=1 Tax=Methylopila sp. M107 TaxID=1101190 RepID=UPI00037A8AE3|nr:calcium-binding protein [Methylopila sp. M107]
MTPSGGEGDDLLIGGAGADGFSVAGSENGTDTLQGGEGADYLLVDSNAELSILTLDAATSIEIIANRFDFLRGTAGDDVFDISGVIDYSRSSRTALRDGDDRFLGSQTGDNVFGNEGDDTINSGSGNDTLSGGEGHNILTGGSGSDRFNFDAVVTGANVDTITDFVAGAERLRLEESVFAALSDLGLDDNEFVVGSAATTADHRIVYDSSTGNLFYDVDGVGGAAQLQFAKLSAGLDLTANDFEVFYY